MRLFLVLVLFLLAIPASAQTFYFDGDTNCSVDETIDLSLIVDTTIPLGSIQLNVTFNPLIVKAENVETTGNALSAYTINNEDGFITIGVISLQGISGNIANITFKGISVGKSPLNIEIVDLTDVNNNPVSGDTINSTITVKKVSEGHVIYVPDDYEKIQWAVDNATDGDMIIVRDGTYVENVNINKPHLTIKSENGSDNCIVQAAERGNHIFYVTANYVNISGFTIKKAYCSHASGIYLYYANYCRISNNVIRGNWYAVYMVKSNNNVIYNNYMSKNIYAGIFWRVRRIIIVYTTILYQTMGVMVLQSYFPKTTQS